MGDSDKQCRPFFSSASSLVVLSFDVVGKEVERLPEVIAEALRSPAVQKAIKDALDKEARSLLKAQQEGKPQVPDTGKTVAENLGKASLDALGSEMERQIKASPQVRKLEKEAKDVLKDFECSPVGVWINKNQTLVYIVGAALALGTGAALYFTKSGDFVGSLVQGKGKVFKIGSLEISGKLTKFKPSNQTIGAEIGLAGDWKPLKASLKLSGVTVGDQGTVSADGKVVVPLTGPLSASTTMRFDLGQPYNEKDPRLRLLTSDPMTGWNQYHYRVAAGLTYDDKSLKVDLLGIVDNHRPSGSVKATYQTDAGSWKLKADAGADIELGNVKAKGTVGLANRRKDLPLEFAVGGQLDLKGTYRLEAGLKINF